MSLSAATSATRRCTRSPTRSRACPTAAWKRTSNTAPAGWWRIVDCWNASACHDRQLVRQGAELSPWLVEDAVRRGHEISCHGWRWEQHAHMTRPERQVIARTVRALTASPARRPVGWHTARRPRSTRGACWSRKAASSTTATPTTTTCRSSSRSAGKPHWWCRTASTPTTCTSTGPRSCAARDFADYVIDAFDRLWARASDAPKMMSIGLHLRIIGRPGRIGALDRIVAHMGSKGAVWFATRRQIAQHWMGRFQSS